MNANEIRAAAERLIVELGKVNHPLHGLSPTDALGLKLARAVLSEHPASGPSDTDPVQEAAEIMRDITDYPAYGIQHAKLKDKARDWLAKHGRGE